MTSFWKDPWNRKFYAWMLLALLAVTLADFYLAWKQPDWLYAYPSSVDPSRYPYTHRLITRWHNIMAGFYLLAALIPFVRHIALTITGNPMRLLLVPPVCAAAFISLGVAITQGEDFSPGISTPYLWKTVLAVIYGMIIIMLFHLSILILLAEALCYAIALAWKRRIPPAPSSR